jgi:hypothetical protein
MTMRQASDVGREPPWLLFMFRLPAHRASQRVKVWRRLQKYGVLAWKNSAYILPNTASNLEKLQWLAAEVRKYHGDSSVAQVARIEDCSEKQIINLFNNARAREYERLTRDLKLGLRRMAALTEAQRRARFATLNRRLSDIQSKDWSGCGKRREAEALAKEFEARSSGGVAGSAVSHKKTGEYCGRLWQTRPRPEIDRVGSAWLIKHFIDPKARFVFSSDPEAHPGAVRFDMFDGEFTHVGDTCTFETLLRHFKVHDGRLEQIAQIIHDADLEDDKFGRPEGRAIELITKGWGKMDWPDLEILRKGFELFDALYLTVGI